MATRRARGFVAGIAAAFALVVSSAAADADVSKGVQKAMKGTLIVTDGPLTMPEGDDKTVVRALKKAGAKSLKGFGTGSGASGWSFNFVAFMKKAPGRAEISLDFYTDDKKKQYVANKRLTGIDPKLGLLETTVDITEDDGVKKGASYIVKLTVANGRRETVLAQTKITLR